MLAKTDCLESQVQFMDYVNKRLSEEQSAGVERHLAECKSCRAKVKDLAEVQSFMRTSFNPEGVSREYAQKMDQRLTTSAAEAVALRPRPPLNVEPSAFLSGLARCLAGAPWWGVSVALHALIILLASLVSMSMELPKNDAIVMLTQMEQAPVMQAESEKTKSETKSALESKHDTPPTDPTAQNESDIVVPPEILAKAELGDHFETINLDRPDTHSAFGNPDSHFFYSAKGNDEPEGGGGKGGFGGLDEIIGIGGPAGKGSGGGWGGGNGTGIGVGRGPGKGSFGSRTGGGRKLMVLRHGGSPATESCVNKALEWLARHQEADGHWDAQKYEGTCSEKDWANTGMTGIALLAFLGAGHTEKVGKYKDNVQRGVSWLVQNQKQEGALKGAWGTVMYSNGIACMALSEAYCMAKNPDVKKAAQMAVDYIQEAQHRYMAWNYYADKDEDARNDTSVSGWQVMALKDAKVAGLKVDTLAFEGALNWLDVGQKLKEVKDVPSSDWEGAQMCYGGTKNHLEGEGSLSMTAAAAMMRIFMGQKVTHPGICGPCNWLKNGGKNDGGYLPVKDRWANIPNSGINYYYWYYATIAMFQMGGDYWKTWNEALKKTVPALQRNDGDFEGSFDPVGGGRIPDGGRVFSTSLAALCMEVYYRYEKLVQ